jgi:hypothetical protein
LNLKGKIKGLFAVCGNMKRPVTADTTSMLIDNHLAKITGVGKVPSKVFLGRLTFGLMEPSVREQMKAFGEEYDNLKRSDCMAFGKQILKSI